MEDISSIKHLIEEIWIEPLCTDILSKKVDVSIYSGLSKQIPDQYLIIEEVFPEDELGDIWGNFEPYLSEHEIFPFLGTLGEAVICIGFSKINKGKIFYFDFDFGCIPFDNDLLSDFLGKLV